MNFYTKLTHRGILQLVGPDTHTFLQGQTTCDIDQLTPEHSITGAYCTPQGRVVCDFRAIAQNDEDCLLSMQRGICDNSASVLGKYIVFSKSQINNASDAWTVFAVWGNKLSSLGNDQGSNGVIWSQVDDQRWECHCPEAQVDNTVEMLATIAQPVAESAWQLEEINAGLAHIEAETVNMFIPQMLNYQATGHISFSKGCYTGQEVVARMHYRGKLKRPMYIAQLDDHAPTAGTALFRSEGDQSVGNIVNSVDTDNGSTVLAVCAKDAAAEGVHLGANNGPGLSFIPLPYSLEE